MCVPGDHEYKKRALDPLEQELQGVVLIPTVVILVLSAFGIWGQEEFKASLMGSSRSV